MLCVCIELSSNRPSVAIGRDTVLLEVRAWARSDAPRYALFDAWNCLVARHGLSAGDVTDLWVGLGPGNYTGLRSALAAAQAFALPGARVYGVSSAAVTAFAAAEFERETSFFTVAGDARGGFLWSIDFARDSYAGVAQQGDLRLDQNISVLRARPDARLIWTDDDTERSTAASLEYCGDALYLRPDAAALWRLCSLRLRHGLASEPLRPLYARPSV